MLFSRNTKRENHIDPVLVSIINIIPMNYLDHGFLFVHEKCKITKMYERTYKNKKYFMRSIC